MASQIYSRRQQNLFLELNSKFQKFNIVQMSNVWRDALVATAIVSILPNLLLVFIPSSFFQPAAKGKKQSINWSNLLLCFAIAGLLGDVFLHILPHMMGAHSHDHHDHQHELASHGSFLHEDTHEHDHEEHEEDMHHHDHEHEHEHEHKHEHEHNHGDDSRSLLSHSKSFYDMIGFERSIVVQTTVLFGFFIFFLAEKLAKSFMNEDEGDEDNHSHNHSHAKNDKATADNVPKGFFATLKHKLAAAGWLNLLADSMHNFTDGIAIGAAFATGNRLRVATFLSVILHEIPHEIGDFTILVQSGLR